jgi:dUTP pyrophosphatase
MRKFEKISFEQFKKDVCDDEKLYLEYSLPLRKTKHSAGYDIFSLIEKNLKPGESVVIPTGVKVALEDDDVLLILNRSSLGFKHNIRICNQVGVIDADYYNNISNEGHILIKIQNEGDHDFNIEKGTSIGQGMIVKYYTTDDDECDTERVGGIGSTNGDK